MKDYVYNIKGMSCGSCVQTLENFFSNQEPFKNVKISRNPDKIYFKSEVQTYSATEMNSLLAQNALSRYSFFENMAISSQSGTTMPHSFKNLFPLGLVFTYLIGVILLVALKESRFLFHELMAQYMAGFFLIFSFFKFLDISGFVSAFQTYDPIATKWPIYGYVYAALELTFAIGYLLTPNSLILNLLVILVLSFSTYGVFKALRRKSKIQCACLGTVFKLPMTQVTLIENISMLIMASLMINF